MTPRPPQTYKGQEVKKSLHCASLGLSVADGNRILLEDREGLSENNRY